MSSRRPLLTALAASAVLLLLAACQQPTPGISVFSGTTSAHREAICWSFEPAQPVEKSDCTLDLEAQSPSDTAKTLMDQVAVIPTKPGETVGISVDPEVADSGWLVSINGRALTREAITDKYFRFTMPPQVLRAGDAQLVVQALTENGSDIRGSWLFGLSDAS